MSIDSCLPSLALFIEREKDRVRSVELQLQVQGHYQDVADKFTQQMSVLFGTVIFSLYDRLEWNFIFSHISCLFFFCARAIFNYANRRLKPEAMDRALLGIELLFV